MTIHQTSNKRISDHAPLHSAMPTDPTSTTTTSTPTTHTPTTSTPTTSTTRFGSTFFGFLQGEKFFQEKIVAWSLLFLMSVGGSNEFSECRASQRWGNPPLTVSTDN